MNDKWQNCDLKGKDLLLNYMCLIRSALQKVSIQVLIWDTVEQGVSDSPCPQCQKAVEKEIQDK